MTIKQSLLVTAFLCSFNLSYAPLAIKQQECIEFESRAHEVVYWVKTYELDSNWIKVFITESGWNFDSPAALKTNNIMGMSAHKRPTQIGYVNTHNQTLAVYPNLHNAVYDVLLWIEINPPKENEDFYSFLKRRNYNPNEAYYNYLKKINISRLWTLNE